MALPYPYLQQKDQKIIRLVTPMNVQESMGKPCSNYAQFTFYPFERGSNLFIIVY